MSDLEDLCANLAAINGEIQRTAQDLHARGQGYARAAARAATAARSSDGTTDPTLLRTAAALNSASQHCVRAAQLLNGASREGQAFVQRTVGGTGTRSDAAAESPTGTLPVSDSDVEDRTTDNRIALADDVQGVRLTPDFGGYLDVVMHGDAEGTQADVNGRRVDFTLEQVVDMVTRSAAWGERPIRLMSCSTGQASYAQELADRLGVAVYAPSDTLSVAGGVKVVLNGGEWRRFEPRQ